MLNYLRNILPPRSKLRLLYHKISAILAAVYYRFPSHRLKIIAVTGTSGKSTTVELIHYLLQSAGKKCGGISTINFHLGDRVETNTTLRTSLRPWTTQKLLQKMVQQGMEFCVLEVSSHAIDQNRIWGIAVDTAIITNIRDNEHLDYHRTFAEYIRAKTKLFKKLNLSFRKPGIKKTSVVNGDDPCFEIFKEIPADRKWTFSTKRPASIRAENIKLTNQNTKFTLHIPNHVSDIKVPLVGMHNLENLLAAVSAVISFGVKVNNLKKALAHFPGIEGRLEVINLGQNFSVVVDFSYKPSALTAVLKTLHNITPGKIIAVWGGAGGRTKKNIQESAKALEETADEIVLSTDDPYDEDPKKIASAIREKIPRKEGENFFEIEDRYEAIRYAILTAEKGDTVLIAGRGHEKAQTIGTQVIPFDDRIVCREILETFLMNND